MKSPVPQAINRGLLQLLGDYKAYLETDPLSPDFVILDEYITRAIVTTMHELQELGVVVRVDKELPESLRRVGYNFSEPDGYGDAQRDMLKAGYVAVEPLLEVKE